MCVLNEKQELLMNELNNVPPNFDKIKKLLDENDYSSEDVTYVATAFAENCEFESYEYFKSENAQVRSKYLYDIVKLLLEYGLNPNIVFDNEINIMDSLMYNDYEYVSADTLGMLLENGGNVNLAVDGTRIFDKVDFAVVFDAVEQSDRRKYDALVHFWFVMLGYGAIKADGTNPVTLFREYDNTMFANDNFDISHLKNHRNYTFGLTFAPDTDTNWSLRIFDKNTMWEAARL
ncbi:MAG: hypothetical protein ACI37Z_08980 [Candidatus Gastranaerophilaceae bacterium]